MLCALNSFPNDNILAVTKLKAFSHNKSNVAKMIISVLDREENIVGKEESACCQHFSFFHIFFKAFFSRAVKTRDCLGKG